MADRHASEASSKCEAEDCFGGPVFEPRLYVQRYYFVQQQLRKHNVTSVVDFGSAECKLSRFLVRIPTLEKISLVDLDREVLEGGRWAIRPHAGDFLQRRERPLTIQIYCGSVTDLDRTIVGYDAVSMVEIIEHLHPDILAAARDTVFGDLQPRVVVMTTPNSDFNVLFPGFSGFRHWDHKFEWTRQEFQEWCAAITDQYPYTVEFDGIGDPPEDSQHLGHCSQAAIFVRRLDAPRSESCRVTETYELIAESKYPHRKLLALSEEDSLLMELQYLIQQYVRASRDVYHVENTDTESNLPSNHNSQSNLPCQSQNSPSLHHHRNSGVNDGLEEDYSENHPSQNCMSCAPLAGECSAFETRNCDDFKGDNSGDQGSQHICGSNFENTCDCMQNTTNTEIKQECCVLGCKGGGSDSDKFCVMCKGSNSHSGRYSPPLLTPDCTCCRCTGGVASSADNQSGHENNCNSASGVDQGANKCLTDDEKLLIHVTQTVKPGVEAYPQLISVQQVSTKENTTSNNANVSVSPKQAVHYGALHDPSLGTDVDKCRYSSSDEGTDVDTTMNQHLGTDVDKIMNLCLGTDVDSLMERDLGTNIDRLVIAGDDSDTAEDGDVVLIPINYLLKQKQIKDKLDADTIREFLLDHGFTLSKDRASVVWTVEDCVEEKFPEMEFLLDHGFTLPKDRASVVWTVEDCVEEKYPADEIYDEAETEEMKGLETVDREFRTESDGVPNSVSDEGYTMEYWD